MIPSTPTSVRPWLLIDTSYEGQLRFAVAQPAARPRLDSIFQIDVGTMPTFTDALQAFERQSGLRLHGLDCTIAMAGITSGEMLSMARSRWTISRSGLAAVFGAPVTIINDVAARAWATRAGNTMVDALRGSGQPAMTRQGRMLMLLVDEGVGACCIDIDRDGSVRVIESEAGHIDFAPSNEREERLAKAVRGAAPFVSWEQMLTLDCDDPVWRAACPDLLDTERQKLLAGLLGRLTVNLMHAYGAWNGVLLTGARTTRLLAGTGRSSFDVAFGARRSFSRQVMSAPLWRIDQREPALTGAAEMMAQRFVLAPSPPAARAAA